MYFLTETHPVIYLENSPTYLLLKCIYGLACITEISPFCALYQIHVIISCDFENRVYYYYFCVFFLPFFMNTAVVKYNYACIWLIG